MQIGRHFSRVKNPHLDSLCKFGSIKSARERGDFSNDISGLTENVEPVEFLGLSITPER